MVNIIFLTVLLLSTTLTGAFILYTWFRFLSFPLLRVVSVFFVGTLISAPILYGITYLVRGSQDPIANSVLIYGILLGIIFLGISKARNTLWSGLKGMYSDVRSVSLFEWLVLVITGVFSFWMMAKSLRSVGDFIFVGSNEVFDFGHSLAIVRSFSWGNNFPFLSPFVAGQIHLYHFMFYFFCGVLEHFGMSIADAVNIPSALFFWIFLLFTFYLPQQIFGKSRFMGISMVLLVLTHSTMTFLLYFLNHGLSINSIKNIWIIQKYLYAAPFDGSPISIFWTLNVFTNQRHLAFGICGVLFTFFILSGNTKKYISNLTALLLGIMVSLLSSWHIVMWGVSVFIAVYYFFRNKQYKYVLFFLFGSLLSIPFFNIWFMAIPKYLFDFTVSEMQSSLLKTISLSELVKVLILNLGVSLLTIPVGFLLVPTSVRKQMIPFIFVFIGVFASLLIGQMGISQKLLNITVVAANVFSIYLLWFLWKKQLVYRIITVALFIFLTASGFIDLMVIKNDFLYPLIDTDTFEVITWIKKNSKPGDIFLSYADIIDPVAFAGRRNYSGFYRNRLQEDRTKYSEQLFFYDGNNNIIQNHYGYRYILLTNNLYENYYGNNKESWVNKQNILFKNHKFIIFKFE